MDDAVNCFVLALCEVSREDLGQRLRDLADELDAMGKAGSTVALAVLDRLHAIEMSGGGMVGRA